ncbi:MarR family transcriptional regulator [Ktedonosporobacter rubrisoli]|uniref:MarR family transcriptional regulator n=1 Tax=Ktedonosporobacter rubrisoli TaxID=2509675 RepID=A0A4P6JKA6_KTERU|nr:MarR family winged helix-turn-helix transcriptional regulator [Ktedonosporobacter rubrisoli]QBD75400.1 MarR family transcriptional regulator [Ktedonosporobacter rubrisoli]
MSELIDPHAALRCAASTIRRTDRLVTQFYDTMLAPSGLSSPQFGLLTMLATIAPITIQRLAEHLGMDRTTLTRNLSLLAREQLVRVEEGPEDRRERLVLLTEAGKEALERAWPLWQAAQARIEETLGSARFEALLNELAAVRAAIN